MALYKVVMVRHGESEWNEKNLFCGWYDSTLSEKGIIESINAGKVLWDAGFRFDTVFTSLLTRAHQSLELILKELKQENVEIIKSWRLNERHYGALTGLNKTETANKFGEEQVTMWRRSFAIPPPPMEASHRYNLSIVKDPRYNDGPPPEEFPKHESLENTIQRTLPFWNDTIVPQIKADKQVLIVAHGNSLRGIVKHLEDISDEKVMQLNIPTGIPFVYTLDDNMKPVGPRKYMGDPVILKKAVAHVANQGKAKKQR